MSPDDREDGERFRALVEYTSDWLWEVDRDGVYTYASPKVRDLLGYEPGEVLGKPPFHFMPPGEAKRVAAVFASIVETQAPFSELRNANLHKKGHQVVLETSGVPIFSPEGAFAGYRGIDRDITERVLMERELDRIRRALESNERRYRELCEHMGTCVAIYQAADSGSNFVFTDFNRAAEKAENISKAELVGRRVTEVFPGVMEFGLLDVFRRVWKTGEAEHFPLKQYKDDRIAGWRENYVYKLPSGEIVAVYEDVTERKRAEEDMIRAYEELKTKVGEAP